jgi:hypothetical protein
MAALAAAAILARLPAGGVAAAVGVPNSGKTYAVQEALELAPWGQRVAVFDPYALIDRARWNRWLRTGAGPQPKRPWFHREQVATLDALLRRPEQLDAARVRLVVTGTRGTLDHAQLGKDFNSLCELLQLTQGIALVGEEAGLYSRRAAEWINTVATGGAHFGMRLVLLAQRLGRIQKDAREGITLVVAGAQGAPEDLDDLRGRCGAAFAEAVQRLQPPDLDTGRPGSAPIAWRLGDGLTQEQATWRS